MIDIQTTDLKYRQPVPKASELSQQADLVEAANNFTSVFMSEYVSFMLDEVEQDDDEFSTKAFSGVYAKALADQIVYSPAGQSISKPVLAELTRLQASQGGN